MTAIGIGPVSRAGWLLHLLDRPAGPCEGAGNCGLASGPAWPCNAAPSRERRVAAQAETHLAAENLDGNRASPISRRFQGERQVRCVFEAWLGRPMVLARGPLASCHWTPEPCLRKRTPPCSFGVRGVPRAARQPVHLTSKVQEALAGKPPVAPGARNSGESRHRTFLLAQHERFDRAKADQLPSLAPASVRECSKRCVATAR